MLLSPPSSTTLPLKVVGADLTVPVLGGQHVAYTNLDYAASAPCLTTVRDAIDETLRWYSSVHRGAGFVSTVSTELLAASRAAVRRFVGGRTDDSVILTRNTTDALNLLSASLPSNTSVITFDAEHHANLLPWRRHGVIHLPTPRSVSAVLERLDETLRQARPGPKLVAVTGASNVTGEVWPIAEIAELAHERGARIVVDAAQLAPHRQIDIATVGIDYVALSGHKLYAPLGAGALVGRADWLDEAEPYLKGGGAVRTVSTADVEWVDGHARHEAGTPNLIGAVGLAVACRSLSLVGFDAIEAHERSLADQLRNGLACIDGLTTYDLWGPDSDRIAVSAFNLDGWNHADLAAVLSNEYGVGVRDGSFCAQPLVAAMVGQRRALAGGDVPGAVRASFGVGTSSDDVRRAISALSAVARYGARGSYRQVDGRTVPDLDDRARPSLLSFISSDSAPLGPQPTEGAHCTGV